MKIDWDRAKELHQRATNGETLSPEDQKYYEEAKKQFQARQQANAGDGFDWQRARSIYERVQKGETVSGHRQSSPRGCRFPDRCC